MLGRQQEGLVRSWAYPGLKKNGMKNWISWSKMGYCKYRQTNASPFLVLLPVHSVLFLFIPEKNGWEKKVYGCGRNGICPVGFQLYMQPKSLIIRGRG